MPRSLHLRAKHRVLEGLFAALVLNRPSFYRLRRVAGEGAQREVQQKAWVQRCVAVVRQAASEELRALRLYVHMAQERLPESGA